MANHIVSKAELMAGVKAVYVKFLLDFLNLILITIFLKS